jgi:hypothetical protein
MAISMIGAENVGGSVIEAGNWVSEQSNNLINIISTNPVTPHLFQ